jgi:urease accessory protein
MRPTNRRRLAMVLTVLAPLSARAHHMMDGKVPGSFAQGLLSGLGHPVIGIDHFVAILAIGVLASLNKRIAVLIAAFFASLLLGVGLHLARIDLPMAELGVALSLVACGSLLLRNGSISLTLSALVFSAAGVFHGYAYGESIVGAELSPLGAYLLGLVAVQSAIAFGAGYLFRLAQREDFLRSRRVGSIGGVFTIIVGAAFAFSA